MSELLAIVVKRVGNLLSVKSIVTVALTIVFSVLSLRGEVSSKDFLTIFLSIITFYFGTQYAKENGNGTSN